jgi:hypothetical protein
VRGRASETTTQTDTSSKLNPGKSQGRPSEKAGLEAHRPKTAYPSAFSQQSPCAGSPDATAETGQSLREAFSCHETEQRGADSTSVQKPRRSPRAGRRPGCAESELCLRRANRGRQECRSARGSRRAARGRLRCRRNDHPPHGATRTEALARIDESSRGRVDLRQELVENGDRIVCRPLGPVRENMGAVVVGGRP